MKLRCREGNAALIIREEPGCECNIGRVVTVQGPFKLQTENGPTWLIEPESSEPWTYATYFGDRVVIRTIRFADMIEHPDSWLLPLRPEDELDWLAQNETQKRLITLGKGKLLVQHALLKADLRRSG